MTTKALISQRIVHGARLIRTGMDDSVVLADVAWAVTVHGATFDEVFAALAEHATLRAATPTPEAPE